MDDRNESASMERTARSFNKRRLHLVRPLYAIMLVANATPLLSDAESPAGRSVRFVGLGVMALGVLTRVWASGILMKKEELAVTGPYAHTRNPLYVGTFLIGMGLGLAANWPWGPVLAVAYAGLFAYLYRGQILWEEQRLAPIFGERYRTYLANVPRFWPRLAPWRPGWPGGGFSFARMWRNHTIPLLSGVALLLALMDFSSGVLWPVLRGEYDFPGALSVHYAELRFFIGAP